VQYNGVPENKIVLFSNRLTQAIHLLFLLQEVQLIQQQELPLLVSQGHFKQF
jgi:hypothetical protein